LAIIYAERSSRKWRKRVGATNSNAGAGGGAAERGPVQELSEKVQGSLLDWDWTPTPTPYSCSGVGSSI